MTRAAKNNALKAIHNTIEENDESFNDDQVASESNSNLFNIPITSQNAPEGQTLDLFKQYTRRVEFCSREIIRIHNTALNKNDSGSEDGGLVYVDFQAGMFEALKVNFIRCIFDDYGIVPISQPKIEYFDKAEERICLDLEMKVQEFVHHVKIKVHNTKCSLDVQGFHDKPEKRKDSNI